MGIIENGKGTTLVPTTSTFAIEKTKISPPEITGGETIDLSHLETVEWKPKGHGDLKDVGDIEFTGHYDPAKYTTAPINVDDTWVITYPSGEKHTFQGYLKTFKPGESAEGSKMECSGTIAITNRDKTTKAETGPVYTSA